MNRPVTTKGNLLRLGFQDAEAALGLLRELGGGTEPLVAILSRTADPDAALTALVRLVEAAGDPDDLLAAVCDDEGTSMRLLSVLGASTALADHLIRHPAHWRELRDPTLGSTRPAAYALREGLLEAVGADPHASAPVATLADDEAVDALRVEYRRVLLRLAARDLAHDLAIDDAAAELSDLAAGTLEASLAIARQRVGETAALARLSVVAMGKCGGHELNYVSDVDVIFVHEPIDGAEATPEQHSEATRAATQLASHLMRVCSDQTAEGHDLAGRRGAAPRGFGRSTDPHPGQPPRLLRALGADLGVPGPVEGAPGGRRPRAGRRLRRHGQPDGVAGGRAGRLRGRHPGDATESARTHSSP